MIGLKVGQSPALFELNCLHDHVHYWSYRCENSVFLQCSKWCFFFLETKVYVGNLGTGAGKGELERAFSYYGPLRTVWIARNPPGFAFVEFEDPRDAEDAVRGLDGKYVQM